MSPIRNAFVRMAAEQMAADLRRAPEAVARRWTAAGRAERCGNLEELRQAARRTLPPTVFDFVDGAAGDEVTAARNREDFGRMSLRPRFLRDTSDVRLATTVLGRPIGVPIISSPMGGGGLVHPSGEAGVARALHDAGSVYILSALGSQTIEHVAAEAPGPNWLQIYVLRDRGIVRDLVSRGRAAGYSALVVTVDTPVVGPRERDRRNGFTMPPRITLRSILGGLSRPRWSAGFVRGPQVTLANVTPRTDAGGSLNLTDYGLAAFDPTVTWADLDELRELWPGPLVLKGLLTPEDAQRAAAAGVDGLVVSNHGGRQLDHAPSTISVLARIVKAADDGMEVYLDGGVRRGTDVVTALALGARACLVGRPLLYGLAVAGQVGAARAVALLADEVRTTMTLMGCTSIDALDETWIEPASIGAFA